MKPVVYRVLLAALMCLALSSSPANAGDAEGRWNIGVRGGLYKLVLTDHSDAWTPGWILNGDVTYGLSSKFSLGVEGSWMQTYLADLGANPGDGAGASFDKIADGPKQRGTVLGLIGNYQFSEEGEWSPYVSFGTGMYFWKWTDSGGSTLLSDDPELDNPLSGLSVPDADTAGNPYELKDQELYVMAGTGLEYYASDAVSLGLGVKFRYLTHLLTDFTGDKDIVGGDAGQLDLPRGIFEGLLGVTFHFGGKCPEMAATGSASQTSGSYPMEVQFQSSTTGGCPEYTYAWDFGDGETSTEPNPKHTYAKEGNYTPSLTVKDAKGNPTVATGFAPIAVSCPPMTVSASGNPTTGTAPFAVSFTGVVDGGCPPFTYAWDFGDGASSAEQSPSHDYTIQGILTTTLTVTDSKGASAKSTVPVTVSSPLVPTQEKSVVLEGVNFKSGKAVLLPESEQILDRVAEILLAHPDVNVEVGGHTDSDGKASLNQKLSEQRANMVRNYLVKKGVPAERMTTKGYGESQPLTDNTTPEGKAKNRRVELKRM